MNISIKASDVANGLRMISAGLKAVEPIAAAAYPLAGAIVAALCAGTELAAGFADQGKEPHVEITRLIDADKDFDAATAAIEAYAMGRK